MSSLNIVLGHSVRTAQTTMERSRGAKIMCVVSPSPRAERRMGDEEMMATFANIATTMRKLQRLEIHFYACNRIWLPAKALAVYLRKSSPELTYMLLNGMRFQGTPEDFVELGMAFRDHPSLKRICLFNTASLDPENVPMAPIVDYMRRNPVLTDIALRYNNWTGPTLGTVCDEQCQTTILRLTGKDALGVQGVEAPSLMHALSNNTSLIEVRVNQCVAPLGTGQLVAEMLKNNKTVETFVFELFRFAELLPIAKVMERDNKTLKVMEVFISELTRQKPPGANHNSGEAFLRRARMLRQAERARRIYVNNNNNNNNGRAQQHGPQQQQQQQNAETAQREGQQQHQQGHRIDFDSDDSDDEVDSDVPYNNGIGRVIYDDVNEATAAFEKALETNARLEQLVLSSPVQGHSTPKLDLFLRLNRAGRGDLLQNEHVSPEEVLGFLSRHNADISMVWYLLRMKPSLIQAATMVQKPLAQKKKKKRPLAKKAAARPAKKSKSGTKRTASTAAAAAAASGPTQKRQRTSSRVTATKAKAKRNGRS